MKNIAYILFSVLLIFVTSCKDEETIYHTAARPGFAVGEQYEVGESVTFTDATIPNEGTKIVAYLWEFGDADKSTSTEQSPTFVFKKDGIYLVKLTVTDSNGLEVSSQKEITVINPTTPDFTFDKKKYVMGDLTTFTDATTTKSGTTITSYLWEFGDEAGTTSDKQNPTFTYTEAGAYAVKLTVTDSYGLTASITKSVTVLDPSQVIAVQWSSALNGVVKGIPSPALAKDGSAVYMLASAGNGAPATLNAFDVTNGAAKWTFDISVGLHDAEPNVLVKDVFSSPSVGKDGSVYIVVRDLQSASAKRHLYTLAVDANGAKKWHQAVGGNVNLYAITPAIDADGNPASTIAKKEYTSAKPTFVRKDRDADLWNASVPEVTIDKIEKDKFYTVSYTVKPKSACKVFYVFAGPADYLTGMYDEQIRYVMKNGVKQTTTYSGSAYGTLPTNINVTWMDEEGRFYEVSKTVVEAPAQ